MELRDYIRIIRKGWVLIAAIALAGIAVAAAYSMVKTPEYAASAKVFVSVQSGATVADLAQGNTFTQNRVKSYAALVTTPAVLEPVISQLHLKVSATQLATQLSAAAPLDTSLIQIDATSTDPAQAAALANAASASLARVVKDIEAPQVDTGVSPVRITQVTNATEPQGPQSPNVSLNLALGALLGLALGLAIAVLRETLDTRIRGERDVRAVTHAPVVGGIVNDAAVAKRPLLVRDSPRSIAAESFRTLRTNFQFLGGEDRRRSFVVTSSVPGEGKRTTVANLAIALADAGRRVAVIDADLRSPKLAETLGLEGSRGLSDLLLGRGTLDDLIQPWGNGNLDVLPGGRIPPNPSELLGSTAMVELIARLEQRYEFVLFDAAPLLPVTDAAVLAPYVAGTLLVVAAGRTRKAELRGAIAVLQNVHVVPAGIVMTMLPEKGPDADGFGYRYVSEAAEKASQEPALETVIPRPAERASLPPLGPRRSGVQATTASDATPGILATPNSGVHPTGIAGLRAKAAVPENDSEGRPDGTSGGAF